MPEAAVVSLDIITDHRVGTNDAWILLPGWSFDCTDRSQVRDGCDCDYCSWEPEPRYSLVAAGEGRLVDGELVFEWRQYRPDLYMPPS